MSKLTSAQKAAATRARKAAEKTRRALAAFAQLRRFKRLSREARRYEREQARIAGNVTAMPPQSPAMPMPPPKTIAVNNAVDPYSGWYKLNITGGSGVQTSLYVAFMTAMEKVAGSEFLSRHTERLRFFYTLKDGQGSEQENGPYDIDEMSDIATGKDADSDASIRLMLTER